MSFAYYLLSRQDDKAKSLITKYNINNIIGRKFPLGYASFYGNWEMFQYLLGVGADITEYIPYLCSTDCTMSLLYSDANWMAQCSLRFIKKLLTSNVIKIDHIDGCSNTLLLYAAIYGSTKIVRYLVEKCAANIYYKNERNMNALEFAVRYGHYNIVVFLLKKGLTCRKEVISHIRLCNKNMCQTIKSISSISHLFAPKYRQKYKQLKKIEELFEYDRGLRKFRTDYHYRRLKKIGYFSVIPGDITKLIVNYI